jgi:hypothetical protein
LPEDEQRKQCELTLHAQVMAVAAEELARHGQRVKRSIKGDGRKKKTGVEIEPNDLGEHWVTFSVAFAGDREGAAAAAERWVERVQTFGGIARIDHVSLRGTDGTYEHAFSEEIEAGVASLDEETLAQIDELMDPNRGSDV